MKYICTFVVSPHRDKTFELVDRDLSDGLWHNLVVTAFADYSVDISLDGVVLENKSLPIAGIYFQLGGAVRMGFTEGQHGMRDCYCLLKYRCMADGDVQVKKIVTGNVKISLKPLFSTTPKINKNRI